MTAPVVLDTSPPNGTLDVAIDATVSFTFDQDILSSSVNSESFHVFDAETLEAVDGTLAISGAKITFTPFKAFFENRTLKAVAKGASSGGSEFITNAASEALADDYTITFRTGRERYVPLDEVTSRSDAESVAPIRAVQNSLLGPILTADESLQILKVTPKSQSSQIDRCIEQITFLFNKEPTGIISDFVEIQAEPALGIEDYLADVDSAGNIWLKDCAPTGVVNGITPADFGVPTGTWSVNDALATWARGTGEPCFNYNTEITFIFDENLGSADQLSSLEAETCAVFTTEYWPFFSGTKYVRTELGPLGRSFQDDTINRTIHKNSIDAFEQAARKFDPYNPFPAVRRYVTFQTVVDLLDLFQLERQALGAQEKALGDLRVRDGGAAVRKYDEARKQAEKALRELRAYRGQGNPGWVIKGAAAYNARCDQFMRTWDFMGWWHGHQIPVANTDLWRYSKASLAGDHDQYGCAPTRILIGKNGGLFACQPKPTS